MTTTPYFHGHFACIRLAVVAVVLAAVVARAGDFAAGNQAYDAGKFAEAKGQYEQLVKAGTWSANVFYNLGNAHHRLGEAGPAILAYERALALEPTHPEAAANLALLRRQTGARLWEASWLDRLFPMGRIDTYVAVAAVAVWVAVFCIAFLVLTSRREKAGLWLGALVGLAVAAHAGAAVWHLTQKRAMAIVIEKQAEARLAPAESAGAAGTLPAGSQVRVLSERGDWIYCVLPGSGRGWIAAPALARVALPEA